MKKLFRSIIILSLTICVMALCACENGKDEPNVPTAEELIASTYNDICNSLGESSKPSAIVNYVSDWADDNNIENNITDKGILVMKKGSSDTADYSLICSVSGNDLTAEFQYLSVLMYAFSNVDKSTTVSAAVIPSGKEKYVPSAIAQSDNVINLKYNEGKMSLQTSGAASEQFTLSSNISYEKSKYDVAYKIKIRNLEGGSYGMTNRYHPNAILTINNILAGCKSNGLNYELAYIKGGYAADEYTGGATAVVVVSKADEEKFVKKLDKSIAKFEKKWADKEPEYRYTYSTVKTPSRVISSSDTDNITSLLYTMLNGIYLEDEDTEETIASTNIGKVSISNGKIKVRMMNCSKDKDVLKNMKTDTRTLSKISHFNIKRTSSTAIWNESDDTKLMKKMYTSAQSLGISLPEFESGMGIDTLSYVVTKNSKAHCLTFGTDFASWSDTAELIISIMK